jgi:hypothetical protein
VELEGLLDQVRRAVYDPQERQQAQAQLALDVRPRFADAIYQPFFLSAMALVLTAGAAWGALLLWKIGFGGSFTAVNVHEVNAHGHAQVMGWVGLFIMGFAYQAFPRMWHVDLPGPRLALAAWLAMLVAIAARSTAMMIAHLSGSGALQIAGVALEAAAVTTFIAQLALAFARGGKRIEPYVGFVAAALLFLFIQTLLGGWHTAMLMRAATREQLLHQIATWQAPLRDVQIHGLALLMILGVGLRLFPALFALPAVSSRRQWLALLLLLTGIAGEVASFLTYRLSGNHAWAAGLLGAWLLLAIGTGLIVLPWRLWRALPGEARFDRSGKFLRVAFAWLAVSFTLLLLMPVYQAISGIAFSHAYYGAIRHAITVGFVSMMIVAMGAKVVATLRGIEADRLPSLATVFVLLNLGCLLRVGLQIGTDWHPAFFRLVGVSGMLEWTALALWSAHLAAMMLGRGRYATAQPAAAVSAPTLIRAEDRVADVLDWYPQTLALLIAHGFTPLGNPLLRRALARQVSVAQACRLHGVDLGAVLADLNRAIAASRVEDHH